MPHPNTLIQPPLSSDDFWCALKSTPAYPNNTWDGETFLFSFNAPTTENDIVPNQPIDCYLYCERDGYGIRLAYVPYEDGSYCTARVEHYLQMLHNNIPISSFKEHSAIEHLYWGFGYVVIYYLFHIGILSFRGNQVVFNTDKLTHYQRFLHDAPHNLQP